MCFLLLLLVFSCHITAKTPELNSPSEVENKKLLNIQEETKAISQEKKEQTQAREQEKKKGKEDAQKEEKTETNKKVAEQKAEKKAPQDKKGPIWEVTIHNKITPDMTTYHYLGAHTPSKFSVHINGKELSEPETSLCLQEPILEVIYSYQFNVGGIAYKKGSKKVLFKVNPQVKSITTSFNWHSKERVIIDHAEFISMQDI